MRPPVHAVIDGAALFDARRSDALRLFYEIGVEVGVAHIGHITTLAEQNCAYLDGRTTKHPLRGLERRWYNSLAMSWGAPDSSVYDAPEYLAEAFACWWRYSRKYVRSLVGERAARTADGVLVRDVLDAATIVDAGCGIGFSTAMLAQAFPNARTVGTNLPGSPQYDFCAALSARAGFMIEPVVPVAADVVLGFEYLEHFECPADHLAAILDRAPGCTALFLASTFGQPSIGHFPRYVIDGRYVDPGVASRACGTLLRQRGFTKLTTTLWNQRPALWRRM